MAFLIHVAAVPLNLTALDWLGNRQKHLDAIAVAHKSGVQVLCFPELSVTGYGCEDALYSTDVLNRAWEEAKRLVAASAQMLIAIGLPVRFENSCYNVQLIAVDGEIVALIPKQNLAGDGVHYEPRWFDAWPQGRVDTLERDGQRIPFGDYIVDVSGVRFGVEICRDAWVKHRTGKFLSERGVDVILNPTASHFAFGKVQHRVALSHYAADVLKVGFVYANQNGNDAGKIIFDGDARICAPGLYEYGERLSFEDVRLLSGVLDVEAIRFAANRSALNPDDHVVVSHSLEWRDDFQDDRQLHSPPKAWQTAVPTAKFEEMTRAITLGLWDYLRKSRAHGFVISLSGGADSAACAVLVRLMVDLVVQSLGLSRVKTALSYIPSVADVQDADALYKRLCSTVYQSTQYSSDMTQQAAKHVARELGAQHVDWSVQPIVDYLLQTVSEHKDMMFNWSEHDKALQNVQARARAPSAWLLANVENKVLLSTSNRSEAAVGYATMDGDTSGGLAPLGGIDKAFLLKWLSWLETNGPTGLRAMPFLSVITQQRPTAELRPTEQTDEEDLMPYEWLTHIESLAIGSRLSPLSTFQRLLEDGLGSPQSVYNAVVRFYRLFAMNQWKRERLAPAFHLDDKNLDPKTWCRYPILSGQFSAELDELRTFCIEHGYIAEN